MTYRKPAERPASAQATGGKPKILVIDDHEMVRNELKRILEDGGKYAVELAFDGVDGLLKFQPGKFDVVLCDRSMPGKKGDEVIPEIKRMDPKQKVIMLSLDVEQLLPQQKKSIGADMYMDKADMGALLPALEQLVKQKN